MRATARKVRRPTSGDLDHRWFRGQVRRTRLAIPSRFVVRGVKPGGRGPLALRARRPERIVGRSADATPPLMIGAGRRVSQTRAEDVRKQNGEPPHSSDGSGDGADARRRPARSGRVRARVPSMIEGLSPRRPSARSRTSAALLRIGSAHEACAIMRNNRAPAPRRTRPRTELCDQNVGLKGPNGRNCSFILFSSSITFGGG